MARGAASAIEKIPQPTARWWPTPDFRRYASNADVGNMDTTVNTEPVEKVAERQRALRAMSRADIKKLYNRARSVRTLGFFWLLAIAMAVLFLSASPFGSFRFMLIATFAVLAAAAIVGIWRHEQWGRYLSIGLCVAILPFLIWGTIFGALGLYALAGSKRLFGPDCITQAELRDELNYRKANNVA